VNSSKSTLTFPTPPANVTLPKSPISATQEAALRSAWPAYKTIAEAVEAMSVLMPSSGAIAGVVFATDNTRGFWKAPANVSLNNVVDLAYRIDDPTNDLLNIDSSEGKSINAIRIRTGRGIRVWGSRTLAGNDNEWRYVQVRRMVSIIEQSIKNSMSWAAFEPNNEHLWLRVKGMISNYLTDLWKAGALQGPSVREAFFVNVGLGTTITSQDLLDGKLIVTIGLAAVRPAEFIIVQFTQLTATS
jgi:phage tail sheath protein FI